jgi:hypothetical protein
MIKALFSRLVLCRKCNVLVRPMPHCNNCGAVLEAK